MLFRIVFILAVTVGFLFSSVGKISASKGEVVVLRGNTSVKSASGVLLEQKDIIKSGKNSSAQLIFNDNTVITVGANTVFKVDEYSDNASDPKATFALNGGVFKAITGKIGKQAPQKFKIETKTATIGIRGTIFYAKEFDNGNLNVLCSKGAIFVGLQKSKEQKTVSEGNMITITDNKLGNPEKFKAVDLQDINSNLYVINDNTNNQGGKVDSASALASLDAQGQNDTVINIENPLSTKISKTDNINAEGEKVKDNEVSSKYQGKTKQQDIEALIASNVTANYSGSVNGFVKDTLISGASPILNDGQNKINLSVAFGATNSVSGDISFNAKGGRYWNASFGGNNAIDISDSEFSVSSENGGIVQGMSTTGLGANIPITKGKIEGSFYNQQATSIRNGEFTLENSLGGSAEGIFSADKR